ncbi:putative low temperature-induced protein [Azorhizobium caulinodans ORS 571]|uniref:Putative low temperature-induced protein n=2 Tax=Azorhizobium caulinodans TaxID=7 RepID=A8HS03_AZOC5|nr:putative low temperature-induced protein [Azorhizobium caulinodans ORS 571]
MLRSNNIAPLTFSRVVTGPVHGARPPAALRALASGDIAMPATKAAPKSRQTAALQTPSNLPTNATKDIAAALTTLLADTFALYLKTKNFHWHMSGPHFRDYHLLLDEQADQIFAMTDDVAERARKIGGTTLRSLGHATRLQRIEDNDAEYVTPLDMLAELRDDNLQFTAFLRETHDLCDEHNDVATASLIENWIDEAERRTWFLYETTRTHSEPA